MNDSAGGQQHVFLVTLAFTRPYVKSSHGDKDAWAQKPCKNFSSLRRKAKACLMVQNRENHRATPSAGGSGGFITLSPSIMKGAETFSLWKIAVLTMDLLCS